MSLQKSKVIHEALFPGECWLHNVDIFAGRKKCSQCGKLYKLGQRAGNTIDYFSPTLPDKERVKLLEAAVHRKFGAVKILRQLQTWNGSGWHMIALPTATIAEAIYQLVLEDKENDE